MINRSAEQLIKKHIRQFRSLAIVGPRQSGKSTLAKKMFPAKPYVSLENPDIRLWATEDPRGFLNNYPNGAVIDEAQRVPALFSYLQQILDETKKRSLFVLTGSNNFLLQASITQSLAGRIGYIDLLPLTFAEIQQFGKTDYNIFQLMLKGSYPEVYDKKLKPQLWYSAYIRTYVERDIKQLRNIENSIVFNKFLKLCAGRTGQMLNVASLSNECGIDVKTVNAWLSILQSSYIIHLLPPHYNSFNKRIVKSPKLYFIDTGLACHLLGIKNENELSLSHFKGALFENFIIMELLKQKHNNGSDTELYYWRDNKGVEIDVLMDKGKKLIPVEIKAADTFQPEYLKSIMQWNGFSNNQGGLLFYSGEISFTTASKVKVMNWRDITTLKW